MQRVRGQVWSMDLIIGVFVFLVAIGLLLFFSSNHASKDTSRLKIEARLIADTLTGDQLNSIVLNGAVDEDRLTAIVLIGSTSYQQLKANFGLRDDFCVVLLDQDDNIIVFGDGTVNRVGFGNANLSITLTDLGRTVECGGILT